MNWTGVVFGAAMALALTGAAAAALLPRARHGIVGLAASMLGVAGICLSLGYDFLAVMIAVVLGAVVPTIMLAALLLAPLPVPDAQAGRRRATAVSVLMVLGFVALGWLLTRAPWPPAGGARQNSVAWLGSRLLTDHLLTLDLVAALLGLAALSATALLRGRRPGR